MTSVIIEPPKDSGVRITRLAFRNRFTNAEKVALYTAAESDIHIRIYLDDVNAATYIDLARPDTIAGVQYLESLSIIAPGQTASGLRITAATRKAISTWGA